MVEDEPSTTPFALLQPHLLLYPPTPGKTLSSRYNKYLHHHHFIIVQPFNIVCTHFYQGGISGRSVRSRSLCKSLHTSHTLPPSVILKCCGFICVVLFLCREAILQLTEWLNQRLLPQRPTAMGGQINTTHSPQMCFLHQHHKSFFPFWCDNGKRIENGFLFIRIYSQELEQGQMIYPKHASYHLQHPHKHFHCECVQYPCIGP